MEELEGELEFTEENIYDDTYTLIFHICNLQFLLNYQNELDTMKSSYILWLYYGFFSCLESNTCLEVKYRDDHLVY